MNIFGIILCVIAVLLGVNYVYQRRKAEALASVSHKSIDFLQELAASMRETGFQNYLTLVKGKICCDAPLQGELSKIPCVYYTMSETSEPCETTDAQGKVQQSIRTVREVVASNQRAVPFYLNDGTGNIRIEPNAAEFVGESVLSRYDAVTANAPVTTLSWGDFQLSLPQSQHQVLGYALEETAIPLNRELYIIGAVSEQNSELLLSRPHDKGQFLISMKSDRELLQQRQHNAKWSVILAVVLAIIGIALIIFKK